MNELYNLILSTSISRQVNKSKVYGKLNISIIYLYYLYAYYIDFTSNKKEFKDINESLKKSIYDLKYKYPDMFCNYSFTEFNSVSNNPDIDNSISHLDNKTFDLKGEYAEYISYNDILSIYSDPENDAIKNIKLYIPDDLNKVVYFNNNYYNNTILTISKEDLIQNGFYIFTDNPLPPGYIIGKADKLPQGINKTELNYSIEAMASDEGSLKFSNSATLTFINSEYSINQPATIGDINITDENRATTVLDLNIFLTQMAPPYNDPESDLIDAIRIDSISINNKGLFKLNGNSISPGQIITREQLAAKEFKHIGPNIDSITTDIISFSARDEGSQIWVQ